MWWCGVVEGQRGAFGVVRKQSSSGGGGGGGPCVQDLQLEARPSKRKDKPSASPEVTTAPNPALFANRHID
jgi:hypothetical protein